MSIKITKLLFLLLPFHVITISILGNQLGYGINDFEFILLKMWKEVFVVTSIIIALFTVQKNDNIKGLFKVDYLIIIFFIIGIFYVFISDRIILALWSFRSLYSMYLFYLLARVQRIDHNNILNIVKIQFGIAIIASIIGIYQVEFYEGDFYKEYYGEDAPAQLEAQEYERMRTTSIFVSVHEFGLYLVFQLFSIPWLWQSNKNKSIITNLYLIFGSLVILVGLFYSYSRSSLLILILGAMFIGIRKIKYLIPTAILLILIYSLLVYFDALSNIETITSGTDSSTIGHIILLNEAFTIFINNIFGIGLGTVGVIARRFDPFAPQFEGEWFNLLVQMGFIPAIIYLFISGGVIITAYRFYKLRENSNGKEFALLIILITMGMVVRDMMLPRDQMNYYYGAFLIGTFYSFLKSSNYRKI